MAVHCPMQKENAELLLGYVERKLSPAVAEVFQRHIEVCDACREALMAPACRLARASCTLGGRR